MADPGEGSGGGAPPLFLDQTETQRGEKFFLETGSPPLAQGLDSALWSIRNIKIFLGKPIFVNISTMPITKN